MNNSHLIVSLDKFEVLEPISNGSFAQVFLVKDKESGVKYAAKVYKEDCNQLSIINFDEMITFMDKFRHPTLAKFIGYSPVDFKGKNKQVVITEYFPKLSLFKVLKENRENKTLDNTTLQIILVGICCGMLFLHKNKRIHRDLKPTNILIDENFHPHLTGFTVSKHLEDGEELSEMVGSGVYIAPEVFDGSYNFKADVYSFSIVMYEVVTGLVPEYKEKRSVYQVLKHVEDGYRPEFKSPIKKSLEDLIHRCWSADPFERPDFEELFNKLAFDKEFYLDGVDEEKLKAYAGTIK